MKNTIYMLAVLTLMMACGTATKEAAEESVEMPESTQKYNYSEAFEMGDFANYDIVRAWSEGVKAGDLDALSALLADSVTLNLWDGTVFNTTRDSVMNVVKGFFGEISDLSIIYHAGMAINSTDRGDAWGMTWQTEQYTDADGKLQRINLQENYRIVDGKIRAVTQYAQLVPEEAELEANNETDFTYSGSWVAADKRLTEAVLGWNNALATPTDLTTAASFLADTVTVIMWDGTIVDGPKDSVMTFVKEFVTGASRVTVDFDAIMAVRSTDMNQNVVMSWTEESWTDKEGNTEHMWIHEDYVREDGKIRIVQQYAMKEPPKEVL